MTSATRGKWRGVSDAALGAIVAHPLRCRLVVIFADRVASPTEAAQELDLPVGDVSYHVRTLKEAGVIELVDERPVRGSTEHFYRTSITLNLTDEEYAALSVEERTAFARQAFHIVTAEASYALESRRFGARGDHHIARVPFALDEAGWNELGTLFNETLEQMLMIRADSEARLEDSGEESIRGVAFQTFFEMPARDGQDGTSA
jgi:DNA-binding transcriptional ArsR family regulator